MRRILFTSNFRNLPIAFVLALLGIFFVEHLSCNYLSKTYFNHEVDEALYKIENRTFNADYLLIGDSVGRQLLRQFNRDPSIAWLATNQAIETTGQFFIIRRYLEINSKPEAVVFAALPFFYRNLSQNYTENFILRTFTRLDEIWDIFSVTYDPSIVVKMFSYKFLHTFKYRLKIQKSLAGFTNSEIYTGVDAASPKHKPGSFSIISLIHGFLVRTTLPPEKSSYVHFTKLLDYLDDRDIPFWYIPVPQEKSRDPTRSPNYRQHQQLMKIQLPPLKQDFVNFNYFTDFVEHDRKLFADHAHYNKAGLPVGEAYMRGRISEVTGESGNTASR